MFPKLLAIYGVARAGGGRHTRARAGASYFAAANIRYLPRLHAPLECRWRIDPMTGALTAFWLDPSAIVGTRAAIKSESVDARRWFSQSRQAARGYPTPRLAA